MSNETKFMIIGAGLSRTGTMTTQKALEMILPGKCYHMIEALTNDHDQIWCDILNEKLSDEEFAEFFLSRGYVAGVNYPYNMCLEQALRAFPDAKVLVTLRTPNKWIESVKETLIASKHSYNTFPLSFFCKLGLFRRYLPWLHFHLGNTKNKRFNNMLEAIEQGRGQQFYTNWLEHVKTIVPVNRLLFFSVTEGWEPLCKFLNIPIPKESFPRVNDKSRFISRMQLRKRKAWLLVYEMVSIPILIYSLYK